MIEDDIIEVQLTCTWSVPRKLAEPWVQHINNVWAKPERQVYAKGLINVTVNAVGGYQPELELKIKS